LVIDTSLHYDARSEKNIKSCQKDKTLLGYLFLRYLLSTGNKNSLSRMRHSFLQWGIFLVLQIPWQIPSWDLGFPTMLQRISYGRFGTTHRSHLQGSSSPRRLTLKLGPIGCPEKLVTNYHSTLRNMPEERRSHLNCDGSLKWSTKSDLQSVKCKSCFSQAHICGWSKYRQCRCFISCSGPYISA
jgi:hypothetical protein